ncbi:serine/threonine-protein kinase [Candidatus Uabimicrobium amorphum]|uniref:Protein kinase n=1 Tax=Uabimicrobium amorphum TaxID=2596890 RepID=A0A5S9IHJ8_UABAM|nr:serine/threonine-protein kinase [Candidatus Uabimicrobium amorphum]BBM81928.1 protein kinase [Candidatus Uabimicrobium amorphum]
MDQDPFIGKKIRGYTIESKLSSGIYKSVEDFTNRVVRLKIVQKSDDLETQKLLELANTLAAVASEAIPKLYTVVEDETHYYMALELIEGKTLYKYFQEQRDFSLDEIFQILLSLMDGLEKGHRLGVVHQNIHPKSIALGENNIVKLLTYGLNLKIGKTGFELDEINKGKYEQGSELDVDEDVFYYWSPELYNNKPLDARSDIYSLGVLFYYMTTNKYPLGEEQGMAYLNRLDTEKPTQPTTHNAKIPKEVEQIIIKMLQPDPQERYQSVSELLADFQNYMQERSNDIRFEEQEYIAKAFIAMPFMEKFDVVYQQIEAACEENKVQAMRVDNIVDVDNIWYAILREIKDCEFIIADFSGDKYEDVPNSNVVTEAAHARAIGKPVVLISQQPEHMFFDWRTQHAIKYSFEEKDLAYLKSSLSRKVAGCLKLVKKMEESAE